MFDDILFCLCDDFGCQGFSVISQFDVINLGGDIGDEIVIFGEMEVSLIGIEILFANLIPKLESEDGAGDGTSDDGNEEG